jgi:hypothetical protein
MLLGGDRHPVEGRAPAQEGPLGLRRDDCGRGGVGLGLPAARSGLDDRQR